MRCGRSGRRDGGRTSSTLVPHRAKTSLAAEKRQHFARSSLASCRKIPGSDAASRVAWPAMQATDTNDVLLKLGGIVDGYRDRGSPLAFFPAVYRATTARVRAGIQNGSFADNARMDRLATTFANRYLATFDAGAVGGGGGRARAWQVSFDAAARQHTMILQHVLLG